jgi:hypothetical protein
MKTNIGIASVGPRVSSRRLSVTSVLEDSAKIYWASWILARISSTLHGAETKLFFFIFSEMAYNKNAYRI